MIDRLTIERIKEAADIVDVVSEFVSLKRSGSNYKGLCPFHNDRTPSFYVSPTRGTCHCFTCGEGGDSVGFLMKHEQLTYPEALRWLANRYGIEIEEKQLTDEQRKQQTEREGMFIANNWAADYYTDILHNDVDGRAVGDCSPGFAQAVKIVPHDRLGLNRHYAARERGNHCYY